MINGGLDIAMKKEFVKYKSSSCYQGKSIYNVCIFAIVVKSYKIIILKIESIYLLADFPLLGPIPAGLG